MEAKKLYARLEKDFIRKGMWDNWTEHMPKEELKFISANYKKRNMGVVCDNTKEINKVYTAVFPSDEVMKEILARNEKNIMLFIHHGATWDIRRNPVFTNMDLDLLEQFKEKRISIYNLHVPLDNAGEYSTSNSLARKIKLKDLKPFGEYRGGLAGIIGKTSCKTLKELQERLAKVLGHKTVLYAYGDKRITRNVAVVAGGGNDLDILANMLDYKVSVLITGISALNEHSRKAHEFERANRVSVIGGTHYSTEKFACMNLCEYFKNLGLKAEFIPEKPVLEDM
jgi:putative NIF3 family GTP cyclohydrolase 1 type 2